MLEMEKIIASLLIPPGLFIVLISVITVYLFRKSKSFWLKLIALFSLLLLIFLSTGFGVQVLLHPLENYAEEISVTALAPHPIVVLGGGLNYHSDQQAEPSLHSMQRLVKGYQLHRRLKTKLIYSGGVAIGQQKLSEAGNALKFLSDLGLEKKYYFAEKEAQTTFENAFYLKKLLADKKIEKVYLVSSAYHLLRAAAVFKAQDIDFLAVHAGFISDHRLSWLDYLPNRAALNANLTALHEWIGLFWYYLQGRI